MTNSWLCTVDCCRLLSANKLTGQIHPETHAFLAKGFTKYITIFPWNQTGWSAETFRVGKEKKRDKGMNCNQSTNKSEGTKERKMSSLSRDYYCGQFSFYPLWSRFTHTRRVHLLFFPCLLVVGLAEVTFGLLALCPHYTRLSAFVFSKENKATQRNETCRW